MAAWSYTTTIINYETRGGGGGVDSFTHGGGGAVTQEILQLEF